MYDDTFAISNLIPIRVAALPEYGKDRSRYDDKLNSRNHNSHLTSIIERDTADTADTQLKAEYDI
jgi:hypothetical protein